MNTITIDNGFILELDYMKHTSISYYDSLRAKMGWGLFKRKTKILLFAIEPIYNRELPGSSGDAKSVRVYIQATDILFFLSKNAKSIFALKFSIDIITCAQVQY